MLLVQKANDITIFLLFQMILERVTHFENNYLIIFDLN